MPRLNVSNLSQDKNISSGITLKAGNRLVGREDEDKEEELLRQAIALSEENDKEGEDDDEELLRQAIALSLED